MKKTLLSLLSLFFFMQSKGSNPDSVYLREHYNKREIMVPMRDGIKLFTAIYTPKADGKKHPVLICRTPYSCAPYGENMFNERLWKLHFFHYIKKGYIMVYQDVRGRYMSEGTFVDVRPFIDDKKKESIDESTDAYDSVDWLLKNIENNNGKAGFYGSSYPGFYSTMAAAGGHPAVKAVSPQAPVTDWFMGDDFHHNGAFAMMDAFQFYYGFGIPRPQPTKESWKKFNMPVPDNYAFFLKHRSLPSLTAIMGKERLFWNEMMEHPHYDAYWKQRDARRACYKLKPAMLITGGLFDAEDCYGAWKLYEAVKKQSSATDLHLVMGPWSHGGWYKSRGENLGNIRMGSATAVWYQEQVEHRFFDHYLMSEDPKFTLPSALVFDTGSLEWKKFTDWPPSASREMNLYFSEKGKLQTDAPIHELAFDAYTSNPNHPVPYADGVHEQRTISYMTDDQRFASRRPDVLTYQTSPLQEDITLCGEIEALLMASVSTTDADFVVKLIDVFPDEAMYDSTTCCPLKKQAMGGYQMLVRAEIMRGRYRESMERPSAFVPWITDTVEVKMPGVLHTFKKGHALMVQVQSSWFPLFDMNPQQLTDPYHGYDTDFIPADIRIYRSKSFPSRLQVKKLITSK